MGPRKDGSNLPPLPDLEPNMLPDAERGITAVMRDCNWLQGLEGDIDTSHLGFLHLGAVEPEATKAGSFAYYTVKNRAPRYKVVDTPGGAMYGAYRPADPGREYWRVAQFLFPFYVMIPTGVLGLQRWARAWVPMDDEHMLFFSMYAPDAIGGNPDASTAAQRQIPLQPNSTDWLGRFRLVQNASNDYLIDRDTQRSGADYTGISGIHQQDQAITESMGSIYDRRKEQLGTSDVMVIRVRRRLMEAARALRDRGVTPPGVDDPEVYRVRSGGFFLEAGGDWIEATRDLRQAFIDHPELDRAIAG
jgi:hypothetical protein